MLNDLNKANQLLGSISEVTRAINHPGLHYGERLARILKIILTHLGVEQGSIMVRERNQLLVKAASRPELVGRSQPLRQCSRVASWVAQHGQPLFIPDVSKDSRFEWRRGDAYKKESLLSVPILHEGKVVGVINVADKSGSRDLLQDDISYLLDFSSLVVWLVARENLHQELKKQRNTLRKRNRELRRQEAMQAELSKMLIHDLKGPLSEVIANLDILSYTLADENREFLEAAQLGCDRAVRMASDLVNVYKIEDGRIKLLNEEVDPSLLLAEAASGIKGLARIKGIVLQLEAAGPLPTIRLDRVQILRVLQNLLINSIGYSPQGTALVLGCRTDDAGRRLLFFVQDSGPGIPADKQKTIFEKYARISNQQDALVGTGLGLYFCKRMVELHQGKIWVESAKGQGSRFLFSLPCAPE